MKCPHCNSSGRPCAYCNPDHEVPMSETEQPAPRHRRKVTEAEVAQAAAAHEHTPAANMPPVRVIGRTVETLSCKLNRLELDEKRVEAMQYLDDLERIEEELATTQKAIKARAAKVQAKLNDARRIASSGVEEREVDVVAVLHENQVVYIRQDTHEELRRRQASPAELQEKLFG